MSFRIGQGFDYHRIVPEPGAWAVLGGVSKQFGYRIIAHSDGDVILHAISNAILGAIGQGDIGQIWSDRDPNNQNLASQVILTTVLQRMQQAGWQILNLDLTFFSDHLLLDPALRQAIYHNLVEWCYCSAINIKATRHEDPQFFRIDCAVVVLLTRGEA